MDAVSSPTRHGSLIGFATMSDTTTRGIRVQVNAMYVRERSDPDNGHYFFAYRVVITNVGTEPMQLLNRHWVITDADENVEEVRGPGVVGETPRLMPQEHFEYTSFCPLPTPIGTMNGSFDMATDDDERFDAMVEPFLLAVPTVLN